MSASDGPPTQGNRLGSSGPVAQVSTGPPGVGVIVPPPLPIRPANSVSSGSTSLDRKRPELDPLSSLLQAPPSGGVDGHSIDHPPATTEAPRPSEPAIPSLPTSVIEPVRLAPPTSERRPENTVEELVAQFLEVCPAEQPHPEGVAASLGGLRLLAKMRNWSRVQSSAAKLMADTQASTSVADARLYYCLASLKLGKPPFEKLQQEVDTLMADPVHASHQEFDHHRLAMELLHAELAQFREHGHKVCIDKLKVLQSRLVLIATGEQSSEVLPRRQAMLWWRRVSMSIVNAAIRSAKWRIALTELQALRTMTGDPVEPTTYDLEICSRIKRVYLQMGSVDMARAYHQDSLREHPNAESNARMIMDGGLIAFASSDLSAAIQAFRSVIEMERRRLRDGAFLEQKDASTYFAEDGTVASDSMFPGVDAEESLLVEAVNNFSIAAMYSCQLSLAVQTLESLIREDPTANMTDATVFNLCTLYELSSDNKVQTLKKKVLREIAQRFFLDDLKLTSFRMSNA